MQEAQGREIWTSSFYGPLPASRHAAISLIQLDLVFLRFLTSRHFATRKLLDAGPCRTVRFKDTG